ncbi:hypothetical protein E3E22_06145 [Thermococcus sp. MV5]|nr:hypothetical protein [Thermococcus sp. MV5]
MYKIFGFRNDEYLGKVGIVEFSIPKSGTYAYLLGNFNAFNEGSFRMEGQGSRWSIKIVHLRVGDLSFIGKFPPESLVKEGQEVDVVFDMKKIHIFDKRSEKAIF